MILVFLVAASLDLDLDRGWKTEAIDWTMESNIIRCTDLLFAGITLAKFEILGLKLVSLLPATTSLLGFFFISSVLASDFSTTSVIFLLVVQELCGWWICKIVMQALSSCSIYRAFWESRQQREAKETLWAS